MSASNVVSMRDARHSGNERVSAHRSINYDFRLNGFAVNGGVKMVEFNFDQNLAGTSIGVAGEMMFKVSKISICRKAGGPCTSTSICRKV